MKKLLKLSILGIGCLFLLTGCGKRMNAVVTDTKVKNNHLLMGGTDKDSPLESIRFNYQLQYALQMASEFTLKEKMNYFSIIEPQPMSNTVGGSLINTPKEFIEKCSASVLSFGVGNDCGTHPEQFKGRMISMKIAIFKEQPVDFLSYNAKETIDYLKKNDMYDEEKYKTNYLTLEHSSIIYK